MSEDAFGLRLEETRVVIVGLGLMGGSLALALRGRCAALLGIDRDPQVLALALERRVVERAALDPAELLPEADLVVLAAPVNAIVETIQSLPGLHPGAAMVLDLGSTKIDILEDLAALPPRFDVIGGHPMCGKESSSLRHADGRLFQAAPFALVPLARSSAGVRKLALELVAAVGGRPLWLDPQQHDDWAAAVSHLPYLLAAGLVGATPQEASALVGPGFRSATRLAASSPAMMIDVLLSNRRPLLQAMARFQGALSQLESAVVSGDRQALLEILMQVSETQRRLLGGDE